MAIFNKSDQQTDHSSNVTTVAAGSTITGKIDIECELHIDGEVDAEINSTGTVKIGQTGKVNGDLRAKSLIVAGKFSGNADCDSIELISGGEADGKLTASSLTIDASSSFQGESIRKQPGESSKVVNFANENTTSSSNPLSDGSSGSTGGSSTSS